METFHLQQLTSSKKINVDCSQNPHWSKRKIHYAWVFSAYSSAHVPPASFSLTIHLTKLSKPHCLESRLINIQRFFWSLCQIFWAVFIYFHKKPNSFFFPLNFSLCYDERRCKRDFNHLMGTNDCDVALTTVGKAKWLVALWTPSTTHCRRDIKNLKRGEDKKSKISHAALENAAKLQLISYLWFIVTFNWAHLLSFFLFLQMKIV